jgi:Kef-type K+ transport system membrane component KefB
MAELLLVILVVVVIARLVGELMERIGQLAILGELLAGVVLGVFIAYGPFPHFGEIVETEVFTTIASLGMLFIMLSSGMEMDIGDLAKASKKGILVALGGMILPLSFGYGIGLLFLPDSEFKVAQCFFLGVALSITAIPALSRVLCDLNIMQTRIGNTLINAAIADDILGLILLAVLTAMITGEGIPSAATLGILIGKVIGFFIASLTIGRFLMPYLGKRLSNIKIKEVELTIALIIALAFGIGAEYAGMHFIIGALVAGMFLREGTFGDKVAAELESKISGITLGFLAPIFFVSIGLHVDLSAFIVAPLFMLVLLIAAIVGKLLGSGIPARLTGFTKRESLAIGIGMNGRGAVEIIVAAIAMETGLFSQPVPTPPVVSSIFSSVVIMAIVTTIFVPLGMKPLLKKKMQLTNSDRFG